MEFYVNGEKVKLAKRCPKIEFKDDEIIALHKESNDTLIRALEQTKIGYDKTIDVLEGTRQYLYSAINELEDKLEEKEDECHYIMQRFRIVNREINKSKNKSLPIKEFKKKVKFILGIKK